MKNYIILQTKANSKKKKRNIVNKEQSLANPQNKKLYYFTYLVFTLLSCMLWNGEIYM